MRLRCAALGDLWRRSGGEIEEETKWEKEEEFDIHKWLSERNKIKVLKAVDHDKVSSPFLRRHALVFLIA